MAENAEMTCRLMELQDKELPVRLFLNNGYITRVGIIKYPESYQIGSETAMWTHTTTLEYTREGDGLGGVFIANIDAIDGIEIMIREDSCERSE